MKLELHFDQPPLLHNDDKKKRLLLKSIQKEFEAVAMQPDNENNVIKDFFAHREEPMVHGTINYRVITKEEKEEKKFVNSEKNGDKCKLGCTESKLIKWCAKCNDRERLRRKEEKQQKNYSRLIKDTKNDGTVSNNDSKENEIHNKGVSLLKTNIENLDELSDYVGNLTLYDIVYEHVYAEGVCFTVADIVLFVYIYHLLVSDTSFLQGADFLI